MNGYYRTFKNQHMTTVCERACFFSLLSAFFPNGNLRQSFVKIQKKNYSILDLGTREKNGKGPGGNSVHGPSSSHQRFCQNTITGNGSAMKEKQQDEETQRPAIAPVNFPPRKRSIPYGTNF